MWPFKKKEQKKKFRKYAAAESGRLMGDWKSTGNSADSEIQQSMRMLRNRSRQLGRDNDYVRSIFRSLEENVIGDGISFQAQVKMQRGEKLNKDLNDKIEKLWCEWTNKKYCHTGGKLHFADIERLVVRSSTESGEIFIRKIKRPFGGGKIPLSLEVIEADLLDENYNETGNKNSNEIRMGVELDSWGRPVAYHFWDKHPQDLHTASYNSRKRIRVPANEIIHLFLQERPSQTRGAPWLASSMIRLHQIYGFEEASVIQHRASASLMGFLETPEGELEGDDVDGDQRVLDFEAGVIKQLRQGEKIVVPNLPSNSGNFDPFMRSMLRAIGAGSGVSYESVSKDYSQSNYSSTRQSLLDERQHYKVLQQWIIRNFHQEVFNEWLDMVVLFGVFDLPNYLQEPEKYRAIKWLPRRWSWIDPLKEIEASKQAVLSGFSTQSEVISQLGGDIEELIDQRKREVELAEENELLFDTNLEVTQNAQKTAEKSDPQDNGDDEKPDENMTPRKNKKK